MLPTVEEAESVSDSHTLAGVMEACMTLDTIQEGKEGSSLSGESEENFEDSQKEHFLDNDPQTENEEKKIKVQWMNDDDEEEENEEDEALPSHEVQQFIDPNIDGGWAWVVLITNLAIFTLTSGLLASAGLYYVQMLKEFKRSRSYTAWMGSLMNAFYMLAGPLCSILIKKTNCRTSIMIGSLLMCTGYLMSAVASSLPFIFFSYGIVVAT